MKKLAVLSASTGVLLATVVTTAVSAWNFNVRGTGVCIPSGEFKITWVLDNSAEAEPMKIHETSIPSLIPAGTEVPAGQTSTFDQTVSGTTLASHELEVKANWPSDQHVVIKQATVNLDEKCNQPEGGMGGGTVETPVTPAVSPAAAAVEAQPQVIAPEGAVNAGGGLNDGLMALVSAAVAGSLGLIAVALRRIALQ